MTQFILTNLDAQTDQQRYSLLKPLDPELWFYGASDRTLWWEDLAQPPPEGAAPFLWWIHASAFDPGELAEALSQLHRDWRRRAWWVLFSGGGLLPQPDLVAHAELFGVALEVIEEPFPAYAHSSSLALLQHYRARLDKGLFGARYQFLRAWYQELEDADCYGQDTQALWQQLGQTYTPVRVAHWQQVYAQDPDALLDLLYATLYPCAEEVVG